jgi:hypothetical protein
VRVFSVANAAGKTVATIGIVCEEHRWRSIGIRAACNRLVTGTLVGLENRSLDVTRTCGASSRLLKPDGQNAPEIDAAAWYLEERLEVMVTRCCGR